MQKYIFQYAALFFIMLGVQVLICNHIALFNVAVPMVFIYFIIRLPSAINKSLLFTLSFLIGFSVDVFSDTLGVNSLACTLIALAKNPMMYAYVAKDDRTKDIVPCLSSLGVVPYLKFLITVVFAFCLMVFSIEYFNFANVKEILIMSVSSTLLTFVLLLGTDSLIITKHEKRL
jgi:rod shape-determining protein mreD